MNLPAFYDKLFPSLAKLVIQNIKNQIKGRLFNSAPFGSSLAEKTLHRRRLRGNSRTTALFDTGDFVNQMKHKRITNGAAVFSTGKTVKEQEAFVLGTNRIPERNPFVSDLPVPRGGTINDLVVAVAGKKTIKYIDKEISKLKGVT